MGKASRTKQDSSRRERIAAQRAAARRAEQRRRLFMAGGAIVAVIIVVVVFVLVKASASGTTATGVTNGPTGSALASVVKDVTTVPTATLDKVGAGPTSTTGSLKPVSGTALTSGGKPEVFYDGAEYCPYCAAQRWAMIVSLSRFGTFSGLSTIHSSSSDQPSNVPTFTFYGSKYTSPYINFTSVEETRNYRQGNSSSESAPYVTLQTPTSAEQALITKYAGPDGSIPFIDFGNKYVELGNLGGYGPTTLPTVSNPGTWSSIASALKNPSSPIAQGVDGAANYTTAAICKLTNNLPATACTPTVKALESKL